MGELSAVIFILLMFFGVGIAAGVAMEKNTKMKMEMHCQDIGKVFICQKF